MTIGELARAGNVNASLIRYYEARGVLAAPPRSGNARRYCRDDLVRLQSVLVARNLGFSLAQIRDFLTRPAALHDIVLDRAAVVDAAIRKARVVRVLLRHASLHGRLQPERYAGILARIT